MIDTDMHEKSVFAQTLCKDVANYRANPRLSHTSGNNKRGTAALISDCDKKGELQKQ